MSNKYELEKRTADAERMKEAAGSSQSVPASREDQIADEHAALIQKRAAEAQKLQSAFGQIVTLLMRAQKYNKMPLTTVEGLVLPALANRQFAIVEGREKATGFVAPKAAILWANVSQDIDQRLSSASAKPAKLEAQHWKSGDIPWLILSVGDRQLVKQLKEQVEKTSLHGRSLKSGPLRLQLSSDPPTA